MQVSVKASHAPDTQSKSPTHFFPSAQGRGQTPPQSTSVHGKATHEWLLSQDCPLGQSRLRKQPTHLPAPSHIMGAGKDAQGVRAGSGSVPGVPAMSHVPARHGFADVGALL
jgi:hypothetical protein